MSVLASGPPLGTGTLVNGGHAHNAVNELRLSSAGEGAFHWVAGTFLQNATGFYSFGINFPTLALSGGTITETRNRSVFTELSYDLLGGKLVPLVGVRYFEDKRNSDSVSNGVAASSSSNPTKVTWRANLAYHMTEDWMLFVNAGTGFRSGILQSQAQADAVIADGVPSGLALTPDELRNIEVGTKVVPRGWQTAASPRACTTSATRIFRAPSPPRSDSRHLRIWAMPRRGGSTLM